MIYLRLKNILQPMCYCKLTGIILNFYFLHHNFIERQNAYKINKINNKNNLIRNNVKYLKTTKHH
ncbi:hypothetical protein EC2845650_0284 [Escherichia coli 2845650]|nr:hypothetical protein EC2845650_0284 [Escherichia coli 2845650]